jgi:VanZ family protein
MLKILGKNMHNLRSFFTSILRHRFAPTLAWMALIFALSSISTLPGPEIISWDFIFKKGAHMFVYAVLFWLMLRSIAWNRQPQFKDFVMTFALVFLYALSDEWHQSFTPGRTPKWYDIAYDLWGAWMAFIAIQLRVDTLIAKYFLKSR